MSAILTEQLEGLSGFQAFKRNRPDLLAKLFLPGSDEHLASIRKVLDPRHQCRILDGFEVVDNDEHAVLSQKRTHLCRFTIQLLSRKLRNDGKCGGGSHGIEDLVQPQFLIRLVLGREPHDELKYLGGAPVVVHARRQCFLGSPLHTGVPYLNCKLGFADSGKALDADEGVL
jgi:hypothetical protein